MDVKLFITDFDGTLVDTFEANYRAYSDAFVQIGMTLSREQYKDCFGLRFDNFMKVMGIENEDVRQKIKELKSELYPQYFAYLKVNTSLLGMIRAFHLSGGKTAIASTAREQNLRNALKYIGAEEDFDLILAGECVSKGKPDPEIYSTVLKRMNYLPEDALIFEDSEVGFKAASAAGVCYIKVTKEFFKNGNRS